MLHGPANHTVNSSNTRHCGTAQANALATEQFWASMIKFLDRTSAPSK